MLGKMLKLVIGIWFAGALFCSAQQNPQTKTVRVCVNLETAKLGGQITNSQRHDVTLLNIQTNALSTHKPDKTHHFVLEGVAVPELGVAPSGIPGRSPYEKYGDHLTDEDLKTAQAKACDYVLFSLVSNTWAEMGGGPHTSFPTMQQSLGVPFRGSPEVEVLVTYRLHAMHPRAPAVEASVTTHDTAPSVGVTRALDMVATQVFEKIAKSTALPGNTP